MADAFIYDAIRTPRGKGKPGGALYEVKPIDLVSNLLHAMQQRHDLDTSQVEDLILACGEPVKEQGQNIAKAALIYAGWSDQAVGAQLHRFCAGGLDAVNMASGKRPERFEDLVAAGGVESMSRLGIGASGGATGDPWVAMKSYFISQGLGADMIATLDGFSREDVDSYALRSQQRAAAARDAGYFKSMVPVVDMNGVSILDRDELIRETADKFGVTSLIITHDMASVFEIGDRVSMLYAGRIEESSTPDEILRTDNEIVVDFLRASGVSTAGSEEQAGA